MFLLLKIYYRGMFVNVQFPFKNSGNVNQDFPGGVMIPKSAIVENGQLTGVYTVSSQNTAVLRWVKVGKTFGDQVEILSGLMQMTSTSFQQKENCLTVQKLL